MSRRSYKPFNKLAVLAWRNRALKMCALVWIIQRVLLRHFGDLIICCLIRLSTFSKTSGILGLIQAICRDLLNWCLFSMKRVVFLYRKKSQKVVNSPVCPGSYRAILNKWISQLATSSHADVLTKWLHGQMSYVFHPLDINSLTRLVSLQYLHSGQETAPGVHFRLESWWGQGPLWIKCPLTTLALFADKFLVKVPGEHNETCFLMWHTYIDTL